LLSYLTFKIRQLALLVNGIHCRGISFTFFAAATQQRSMDKAHPNHRMPTANDLSNQIFKNSHITEDKNFFVDDGSLFIGF
jgi:hypothetical protein